VQAMAVEYPLVHRGACESKKDCQSKLMRKESRDGDSTHLSGLVGLKWNPSEESPTEAEDRAQHNSSFFRVSLGESVDPSEEERVRRSHQTEQEVAC